MVRKRYRKKEIALAAGCLALAVAVLTFYIWHQAALVSLGYKTGKLEQEIRGLQADIKKLETEKASLLALDRVEKTAREKLHLSEPKEGQIIYEDIQQWDEK
jgi:cell division protein FtsL